MIGEEKSEKSLIGSTSSNDGDSKPYDKFRDEVNKLSRVSTAATHPEFINEISHSKYFLFDSSFVHRLVIA